jgi:hypothetical protein
MLDTLANKQALAEGVLERKGDLAAIPFGGGKQAFLERLNQLVHPAPALVPSLKPLIPTDRVLTFARLARERLNGALIRCEEQYPLEGGHSVLLVVVDRESSRWRDQLNDLHQELFGSMDPLSPTYLEVVDRDTVDALERLVKTGLLQRAMRGSRPLLEDGAEKETKTPLSEEEKQTAAAHRAHAARRLKMSRVLGGAELLAESRQALLEAVHALGSAFAVENRLPEPKAIEDILAPSLAWCWGEKAGVLKGSLADDEASCEPLALAVEHFLKAGVAA